MHVANMIIILSREGAIREEEFLLELLKGPARADLELCSKETLHINNHANGASMSNTGKKWVQEGFLVLPTSLQLWGT